MSTIETIGLTYAGTDIQDFDGGIFLEITQGLFETGEVRGVDVTVPGRAGQLARPRRFHQRTILLAGYVFGVGSTESVRQATYRTNLDTLVDLFSETADPADLVALTEDGSTRTIACRTAPGGRLPNEVVKSEYSYVSIELVAVEDWAVEAAGS